MQAGRVRHGGLPAEPDAWHMEHINPITYGGEHPYANTAVSHPDCNLRKGTKTWSGGAWDRPSPKQGEPAGP